MLPTASFLHVAIVHTIPDTVSSNLMMNAKIDNRWRRLLKIEKNGEDFNESD